MDVGSLNGTAYSNTYEFSSSNLTGAQDLYIYQTLTLAGSWPLGLAFATRVNGTVVGTGPTELQPMLSGINWPAKWAATLPISHTLCMLIHAAAHAID